MELKEFIKTALTDIVTAVKETQESVQEFATIALKDGARHKGITRREFQSTNDQ